MKCMVCGSTECVEVYRLYAYSFEGDKENIADICLCTMNDCMDEAKKKIFDVIAGMEKK